MDDDLTFARGDASTTAEERKDVYTKSSLATFAVARLLQSNASTAHRCAVPERKPRIARLIYALRIVEIHLIQRELKRAMP